MDDIKKAMMGDREAQQRLTEKGVLLPCPMCGGDADVWENSFAQIGYAQCYECGLKIQDSSKKSVLELWNAREPILTPEQIKRLEEMENDK